MTALPRAVRLAAALVVIALAPVPAPAARAQAPAGVAQVPDTLYLHRLRTPIVFDGMPDEPEWDSIPPLAMTVFSPVFGIPATERTEIRLAYDDQYIYVSGRLYDRDPNGVRINTLYRDQYSGDDIIGVVLDTYNDHQTASWFVTNPAGVRTDRAVSNDAEFSQGSAMNPDWNTFWDARTARTEDGWFVEMRIPFSSLGFQDVNGRVVMGLSAYRMIARKNERHLFPPIPPSYGGIAFAKPSQFEPIVLEGVRRHQPVYVTPYGLGGVTRDTAELNGAGTSYLPRQSTVTHEAGLDVRVSPTSNLTLDVTANTDFAQVEVDDQQINLTRFSLFFPEKRQFFQERSAIFDFGFGDLDRLFYSRQIGLVDDRPIRILGGARLVGRVGTTDLGLIDMQTAARDLLPTENLGVLRLKRQVINQNSTIGAMVTSRRRSTGGYNVAGGVDAVIRPFGDHYLTLKWAETFDSTAPGTRFGDLEASRMLARFERRNQNGFSYVEELIRSGSLYDPALGFNLRTDVSSSETHLRYQWFGGARTPFRSLSATASNKVFLRNSDHTAQSALIEPQVQLELKRGYQISLSYRMNYESVTPSDTFEIGDTRIPTGNYWFPEGQLSIQPPMSATFRPRADLTAGRFYDGRRVTVTVNPAWNPSSHLELGLDYSFNAIRFPDRDLAVDLHVARIRIQAAYDAHLSLSTFLQYNGADDLASVNARLRYNFREGNDLWIVYNETVNTDRAATLPELPLSQSRGLMVKYTHTLVW